MSDPDSDDAMCICGHSNGDHDSCGECCEMHMWGEVCTSFEYDPDEMGDPNLMPLLKGEEYEAYLRKLGIGR